MVSTLASIQINLFKLSSIFNMIWFTSDYQVLRSAQFYFSVPSSRKLLVKELLGLNIQQIRIIFLLISALFLLLEWSAVAIIEAATLYTLSSFVHADPITLNCLATFVQLGHLKIVSYLLNLPNKELGSC